MAIDWDTVKTDSFSNQKRLEDLFETFDIRKAVKWKKIRPISGELRVIYGYWFKIVGKENKQYDIFKMATNYDSANDDFIKVKGKVKYCPYQELANKYGIRPSKSIVSNIIDRAIQKDKPAKLARPTKEEQSTNFKVKGTDTWTPVVVFSMNGTVASKIKNLAGMNERKTKDGMKEFGTSHPIYGFDVALKYNKDLQGVAKFDVNKDANTKLTDEEKAYFTWDLSLIDTLVEPEADAKSEADKLEKKLVDKDGRLLYVPGKKSKSSSNDDLPDDIESDIADDLDDDDEKPTKKSSKRKKVVEDEDEDEKPVKKSSSKRKVAEEDEDELELDGDDDDDTDADSDDDLDLSDDDEDEKPAKKSSKKRKVVEEDEEPAPKKKSSSKRKVVEDEEDDLDGDLDLDSLEDDEDEKPAKKSSSKRKVVEDDDDEDAEEEKPVKKSTKGKAAPPAKSKTTTKRR